MATVVHDFLHSGLQEMKAKVTKGESGGYLKGCTYLLLIWAYEVFDVAPPVSEEVEIIAKKYDYSIPFANALS